VLLAPESKALESRLAGLSTAVVGLLMSLTFAFVPVAAMILASQSIMVPEGSSVARITLLLLASLTVVYCVLRRRTGAVAASNGLALPLLLGALYPGAMTLVVSIFSIRESIFAWAYLAFCVVSGVIATRLNDKAGGGLREVLGIIAAIFLFLSLFVVGRAYGNHRRYAPPIAAAIERLSGPLILPQSVARTPDVFHLILDGMGRPDVLTTQYAMNMDGVIERFRHLGFQIDPAVGHANYVQTHMSLPSMLNLTYLDDLARLQGSSTDREPLRELVGRARAPRVFRQLGYRVEFIGGGSLAEGAFQEADICDCPQLWFSEAEAGSLSLTPLKVLLGFGFGQERHFRRSISVFEAFERERNDVAPRYVYAHVMLPHPPFVANQRGEFVNPRRPLSGSDGSWYPGSAEEYRDGYRAQATFTLTRALQAATRVLDSARRQGRDVIIIITGDHGPRLGLDAVHPTAESGRFTLPVLLAIRWPAGLSPEVPPTSLVNVYRVLFGTVFGMKLPRLPDRAFVSGFTRPYQLIPAYPEGQSPSLDPSR
jgi:hypothetical protein